jgi:hypothetical protein
LVEKIDIPRYITMTFFMMRTLRVMIGVNPLGVSIAKKGLMPHPFQPRDFSQRSINNYYTFDELI